MNGTATIIHYNINAHAIVSAAGRISTTTGSANEVYELSVRKEEAANMNLIHKILSSGHESVLEHISCNLSFDNVSVFVEQFMIEFRLASFTVKSRRYVDFGKMGYVTPDFSNYRNAEELRELYAEHMEYLFGEYNAFVDAGIPKEDARFVLPYSFRSNFYCTVNARELIRIMNEMVYGRGRDFPELVELGQSLFAQCEEKLPYINVRKSEEKDAAFPPEYFKGHTAVADAAGDGEYVTLIRGTDAPEKVICQAAALSAGIPDWQTVEVEDESVQKKIISGLLLHSRKRELEQVGVTILFKKISLAGITHLVRHRMQSLVLPDFTKVCDFSEYILPKSIREAGLEERYREVFTKNQEAAERLFAAGFLERDKAYLLLSGMTASLMTTMNANELYTFFRLRTCNRAQWEIKSYADDLLKVLREKYPVLFSLYGPSCYVMGVCPEGKMTCGKKEEVCRLYQGKG